MAKPWNHYALLFNCLQMLVTQFCSTLWNLTDCSLLGFSVHGILQARILGWVAFPFSRGSSQSRDQTCISCTGRGILYHWGIREAQATQLCPILCDPMDCNLLGFSVHGILQARILEWVAIPFSRGSSWPRDWSLVSHVAGRFFTIWTTREAPLRNIEPLPLLSRGLQSSAGDRTPPQSWGWTGA